MVEFLDHREQERGKFHVSPSDCFPLRAGLINFLFVQQVISLLVSDPYYGGDVSSVPCVRNVRTSGLCMDATSCATIGRHVWSSLMAAWRSR